MHTPTLPQTLTLIAPHTRLEPLQAHHAETLFALVQQGGLNTSPILGLPQTFEQMHEYIGTALRWKAEGTAFPFVTVDVATNHAMGTTRFANFAPEHFRIEIGWTWLAVPFQRTRVNTEVKYTMLRYAFEELGLHRVELKAHALNQQSRTAMERLGAQYEGILREHTLMPNGTFRDTVYYSILAHEWVAVKARLEERLCL
jgi:RimJ/RimL family protein N-acetyltransferase